MAVWSWVPEFDIQRENVVQDDLPTAADTYGARDVDSLKRPIERATFTGDGLTTAEVTAVRAIAIVRDAEYTASTLMGDWTGQIESFKASQIRGTDRWNASLTLLAEETPFDV